MSQSKCLGERNEEHNEVLAAGGLSLLELFQPKLVNMRLAHICRNELDAIHLVIESVAIFSVDKSSSWSQLCIIWISTLIVKVIEIGAKETDRAYSLLRSRTRTTLGIDFEASISAGLHRVRLSWLPQVVLVTLEDHRNFKLSLGAEQGLSTPVRQKVIKLLLLLLDVV